MIWKLVECNVIEERPIPSHPGYAATSDGHIISLAKISLRGYRLKRKEVSPSRQHKGYLLVNCGSRTRYRVHRLVLEAFIGPCPDGMECCHNNGNKQDNCIENLRWDTRKANSRDSVKHGVCPLSGTKVRRVRGTDSPMAKLTDSDVLQIRYLARTGVRNIDLAKGYGVVRHTISNIVHRRAWKHLI